MTSAALFTLSKSCGNLQEGRAKVFVNVCFILNLHDYSARTVYPMFVVSCAVAGIEVKGLLELDLL